MNGEMIKVGDIVYFHGTCGMVTHISKINSTIIYDIVASDGSTTKETITEITPKDYQVYKIGRDCSFILDLILKFINGCYKDATVQFLIKQLEESHS